MQKYIRLTSTYIFYQFNIILKCILFIFFHILLHIFNFFIFSELYFVPVIQLDITLITRIKIYTFYAHFINVIIESIVSYKL